jgi:hypothetical protein
VKPIGRFVTIEGSSSFSGEIDLSDWQHSRAHQFDACAAEHSSLDCFQTIDLAFGRTTAPWFGDRVPDGGATKDQSENDPPKWCSRGLLAYQRKLCTRLSENHPALISDNLRLSDVNAEAQVFRVYHSHFIGG